MNYCIKHTLKSFKGKVLILKVFKMKTALQTAYEVRGTEVLIIKNKVQASDAPNT